MRFVDDQGKDLKPQDAGIAKEAIFEPGEEVVPLLDWYIDYQGRHHAEKFEGYTMIFDFDEHCIYFEPKGRIGAIDITKIRRESSPEFRKLKRRYKELSNNPSLWVSARELQLNLFKQHIRFNQMAAKSNHNIPQQ